MKKQILKKSDVLREGYIKGLKEAQRVISEQLNSNITADGAESDESKFEYSAKLAKNDIDKLVAAYKSGNFHNGGVTAWNGLT